MSTKLNEIPRFETLPEADRLPGARDPQSRSPCAGPFLLLVPGWGQVRGISSSPEPGAPSQAALANGACVALRAGSASVWRPVSGQSPSLQRIFFFSCAAHNSEWVPGRFPKV